MVAVGAELRSLPYPYQAMLAVCSDLDETPDRHVYREIVRYLNTTETTAMGPGVGLEVGNTIYFDMPPGQFSFWNTDDTGRAMVYALIESGHIDCLHSYGDLATTRAHAARALEEFARHGCCLEVWVDHAVAPSNFGADIMHGSGDVPGSPVYHADLTCSYGVKYVWRGRVTSVIGQDVRRSLRGVFHPRHPLGAARTLAKEAAKGLLARRGHVKYAMHGPNRVLRRTHLRDGREAYEFLRCNPYWGGVQHGATADGIADVLTPRMLRRLIDRGGVCVLYTHLGKVREPREPFGRRTHAAFRRLAEHYQRGEILVTTTRRLLGYCRMVREIEVETHANDGCMLIDVRIPERVCRGPLALSRSDLDGLTIYTPEPESARVLIDGGEVADLRRNRPDHTGRRSISLPWPRLEFPSL